MSPFLYASLALFVVWCALLFFSPRTRHEQLTMSLIGLVVAPGIILLASTDYRSMTGVEGTVGVEDLLFSFSLFGTAAVLYQAVFAKHAKRLRGPRIAFQRPAAHWLAHIVMALGIWACISLSLTLVLALTTVQSAIVGGLLVGTYVIADRKDLMLDALLSGILLSVLIFAIEQLFFVRLFPDAAAAFWQTGNLSGLFLGGIPVEELLWSGVVGFTVGPLYEYMRELKWNA